MDFFRRIYSVLETHDKSLKRVIFVSSFVLFFLLYQVTEYYSDDLVYMNIVGSGEKVQKLKDVVESQIAHYFIWGGRTVAHTILQVLLLLGKPISSISTALMATSLSYICVCYGKKRDTLMILFATASLYFLNPDFEDTIQWLTGSCNYLWTITICLVFFLPYLNLIEGKDNSEKNLILKNTVMLLGGIVAGWTNENIAPVFVLMTVLVILWRKKEEKDIPHWTILGLIGLLLGTAVLLLAPGNGARSASIAEGVNAGYSLLKTIVVRGYYIERAIFTCLFPILLLLGITILVSICYFKTYPDKVVGMFCVAGVLSVGAMIMSPTYPIRATFGSFVLFTIALIRQTSQLLKIEKLKKIYYIGGIACYLAFVMQMLTKVLYIFLK